MADKEYIERGAFLKKCAEAWGYAGVTIKAIEGIADECTAADVVEVVRCKDCKHSNFETSCSKYRCGYWLGMLRFSNDFCSYGERKE